MGSRRLYFEEDYRPITLDLRGHGRSDAPATGYHIDDMARGIDGVLDVSGIERAHVIGSSLGAEVGLGLAANYPERVRSLVAEDAMHPFGWVLNPEPMARAALRFLEPRD